MTNPHVDTGAQAMLLADSGLAALAPCVGLGSENDAFDAYAGETPAMARPLMAASDSARRLPADDIYRFVTETAGDIIARHSHEGHALFVSPAVEAVLGYGPEEIVGMHPLMLTHAEDHAQVRAAIAEARSTGEAVTYAYRARHRAGHHVWLETRVRFVRCPRTGQHTGALSVTRDITARKQIEEDLRQAREKAEAASHTKSRFLANMSHELRTPLNAIIGFSDIIARELLGPLGNARYAEYVRLIHDSGGLLLELINDLLDMSKIEAGKFEIHPEAFLAEEGVGAALELLKSRAAQKGLVLAAHVEPAGLMLRADRRAFKQILLNLVSNSIKFTPAGGAITVDAGVTDAGVRVRVRDTGIGIAPDVLPRLARPFEQATGDGAQGGSGLGLALVKSLTLLHDGSFEIASQPGHGTTVTIVLPLATEDARSPSAA